MDHSLKAFRKPFLPSVYNKSVREISQNRLTRLYARSVKSFSRAREFYSVNSFLFFSRDGGGERLSRNRNARRVARDSGITPRRATRPQRPRGSRAEDRDGPPCPPTPPPPPARAESLGLVRKASSRTWAGCPLSRALCLHEPERERERERENVCVRWCERTMKWSCGSVSDSLNHGSQYTSICVIK